MPDAQWPGGTENKDHIEDDILALSLPRGRRVGQPGHETARRYLLGRMGEIGLAPLQGRSLELPYRAPHPVSGAATDFANLVGTIPGANPEARPLLIGAHYDSAIDAPCTDDNAAAVAVVLAVAEVLTEAGLSRPVIVAIFDAEEMPFFRTNSMGSLRFYRDHCSGTDFACAIIMDLIGHDVEIGTGALGGEFSHLKDLLFVLGSESHGALPGVVERASARAGDLRVFPTLNAYVGDMSDHHAFRLAGEPYLFLSCGRGRYYHDERDDPTWANLSKIRRVCDFVVALLREADPAALDTESAASDTTDFEIRMMHKAIGPAFPLLLTALSVGRLQSRADIDRLARVFSRSFVV